MANVQIFLSAASDEFRQYRIDLRNDLDRHNVNVKIQDYLTRTGRGTMLMLDDGIQPCEAVIHLVGDKPGQCPSEEELGELRHRYSDLDKHPVLGRLILGAEQCTYTQWEAYMAIYHGKDLYIATRSAIPKGSQAEHRKRLLSLGRHPDIAGFDDYKDLLTKLLKTTLVDILAKAEKPRQRPPHLPPPRDLVGRSELLARIRETLPPESASDPSVSVRVLAGLGGVGKTSLAIGYAMQFADSYTTRALISSSSPQEFRRSLADLALSGTIDAVGAVTQNEEQRRHVVLDCLRHKKYRPWLLILDNVDTKEARDEIIGQLSQFQGGHILVTSRLRDWKAPARVLHVDVLSLPDAADLLLTRTDDWRTKEPDDDKAARELAGELGRLPLALDQASAYIETHEIGLREYLRRWRSHQPDVQKWFPADSNVPQEAVVTWQTSIDQLDKAAEVLLWLLAWLAPGPLPAQALTLDSSVAAWDRCVQHCIPNYATSQADGAHTTGLERMQSAGKLLVNLSLVSRDNTAPTPTISMHQVVREIIHTSVATLRPDCAAGLRDAASAIVEAALGRTEWIPYLSAHADALAEAGGTFEEFPLLEDHIAGMAVLKGLHDGSW